MAKIIKLMYCGKMKKANKHPASRQVDGKLLDELDTRMPNLWITINCSLYCN